MLASFGSRQAWLLSPLQCKDRLGVECHTNLDSWQENSASCQLPSLSLFVMISACFMSGGLKASSYNWLACWEIVNWNTGQTEWHFLGSAEEANTKLLFLVRERALVHSLPFLGTACPFPGLLIPPVSSFARYVEIKAPTVVDRLNWIDCLRQLLSPLVLVPEPSFLGLLQSAACSTDEKLTHTSPLKQLQLLIWCDKINHSFRVAQTCSPSGAASWAVWSWGGKFCHGVGWMVGGESSNSFSHLILIAHIRDSKSLDALCCHIPELTDGSV